MIPVLIVQDLWRGSAAERPAAIRRGEPGGARRWSAGGGRRGSVSLLRFAYSGANFHDSGSLDDIEASNTVALVGVVVLAVAAVLAVLVVRQLSRRQLDTLRAQRARVRDRRGEVVA